MKKNLINLACPALAILAAAWCGTARADLGTETTDTSNLTSWDNAPSGGSAPFYVAWNLSGTQNANGQPSTNSGAAATALSETFTIAPGDGTLVNGNTNYVLTGIGLLMSGSSSSVPWSIHLFDVTSNLTSGNGTILQGSGATYNFTYNGDLLGNGAGLSWLNNVNGGAKQQVFLPLLNGPSTDDQVVLGAGHTYAFEVWTPTNASGAFTWFKSPNASGTDLGGEGMGSHDASFSVARQTLSTLGQAGAAPRTFGIALYGSITSAAASVNTNIAVPATNISYIIDDFYAYGYGPSNALLYVGTNNYTAGGITNVWTNWFGSAWVSNYWDPTMNALGTPNAGSLKITATFSSSNTQFAVFNNYSNISPPLNALTLGIYNFQCDVLFASNSPTTVNGTATNYGHLRFGMQTNAGAGQDYWGTAEIGVGTTNWTHVTIPINVTNDNALVSINDVVINIDGNYYSSTKLAGTTTLWVDNIKFAGPLVLPPPLGAPTMGIQKTAPELRIFAGSSVNTYDREELSTYYTGNQTWINQHFPVTYSFTLLDFPVAPGMQCHLFLVPIASLPASNAPTNNEYIDYQASNDLWLDIAGGGTNSLGTAGYTVNLYWKANATGANAANQALTGGTYTNSATQSPVGTWSLTFNNNSSGTLTPPQGVGALPFVISDPDLTTDFGGFVEALIGLQPNSVAGEGTYIDYGAISITGTQYPISENFVTDPALGYTSIAYNSGTSSGLWDITDSVNQSGVVLVNPTNTPVWVTWTLPAIGYGLGEAATLPITAPPGAPPSGGFIQPGYNDVSPVLVTANHVGGTNWTLVPSGLLPANDPNDFPNGGTNAYFELTSPPP